ncbi:uncharacterized protein LOC135834083 [Planococcus citri]|uniref:uncharacterized protein LOC135834083 n=1 Tax=Planococcus citri TaxID=170843 RepID=UPI0031F77A20
MPRYTQKQRLSAKRDSIRNAGNLNQSGDVSQRQSLPAFTAHAARKSIVNGNASFQNSHASRENSGDLEGKFYARKSFYEEERRSLPKKTPSSGPLRRSTRQSGIDGDKKTEKTPSTTVLSKSKTNANKVIKKSKKSVRSRSFAATRVHRRRKPGVLALQQIRHYQKETGMLIPKLSFQRLVKEVLHDYSPIDYRIQSEALRALQEAAEMHLVRKFENGQLCAVHAHRVTLMTRDFTLLKMFEK